MLQELTQRDVRTQRRLHPPVRHLQRFLLIVHKGDGGKIAKFLFVLLLSMCPLDQMPTRVTVRVKQDHPTHTSTPSALPPSSPPASSLSLTGLRVTVTHYIRSSGRDKSDRREEHLSTHARLHLQVGGGTPLKTTTRPKVYPRPGRPRNLMSKELHCVS